MYTFYYILYTIIYYYRTKFYMQSFIIIDRSDKTTKPKVWYVVTLKKEYKYDYT
ncbi:hypothetical protein HanIR_Chr15g0771911 [Helianthus annuus]|nr:hypothetical protein HanIR_Chr15g0771911 [Helianthus annuus]